MRLRFTGIALLPAACSIITAGAYAGTAPTPHGIRDYAIGAAPLFTLANMDGESLSPQDTRGEWVFVHFWASWCGPCREEMPAVQRMAKLLVDEPLQIVLINMAEDEDTYSNS